MAGLVIDASVAAKWFLAEDRSADALEIRRTGADLIAPDLVVIEVFNSIWAAARKGRLATAQLAQIEPMLPLAFSMLVPVLELYQPASNLARRLEHPIYDTLFLALAEREGLPLVTADERLFAAGRKAKIPVQLL
ncbi:MAG TPA: type II toxin-antitoxin system VapC family toxin [Microvirga sp.]|nr:type II toxin-antitoxin system VapC family toxin [Microvirga sp.]